MHDWFKSGDNVKWVFARLTICIKQNCGVSRGLTGAQGIIITLHRGHTNKNAKMSCIRHESPPQLYVVVVYRGQDDNKLNY